MNKLVLTRKLYVRTNNRKVDSIEIGRIVIAYLLPSSDQKVARCIISYQLVLIKL